MRKIITAPIAALAIATSASAQLSTAFAIEVGSPAEEYVRVLQLTGVMPLTSLMIRPARIPTRWHAPDTARWRAPWVHIYGDDAGDNARSPIVQLLAPTIHATYNSAFPSGRNDGAMWAGRGSSALITTGAQTQWRNLKVRFAPEFTWSENQDFELAFRNFAPPAASPYADQWLSRTIDRPQRFGASARAKWTLGQSALDVTWRSVKAGIATENAWWGPGIENSLLLSNHAAGFPRGYVGTEGPVRTPIGSFELEYSVGWLSQSNFWRITPNDSFPNDRWTNMLALVFEPRGAPGMYFGAARVFLAYRTTNPITLREALSIVQGLTKKQFSTDSNPNGTDTRDQMAALWFRWVFPTAGFEAYGEYGKTDHNWDWRDFALEPDHARAYLLGARKVFRAGSGVLALRAELTDLGATRTAGLRGAGFWYAHSRVQQGYTHHGEVIGAGIGTGSDQQIFAVDWYQQLGRVGVWTQRTRHNSDSFYVAYQDPRGGQTFLHDVTVEAGMRAGGWVGPARVDVRYGLQYEFNRYTMGRNDHRNHSVQLLTQFALP